MRIPFPERISIYRVAIFAAILFLIQSVEGTALYFSAGCAAFLMIATLAFNAGGGLSRVAGAYVFFYSVLVVVIGLCYKALLGEPADSNLRDPRTTIAVYDCGIAAMFAAVVVSRRFSRKVGLLQNIFKESDMYRSCVGCIVFGIGGAFLLSLVDTRAATLNKAFTQLNELVPLAIIIGVMYEIRRSGGRRSINLPVAFSIVYLFFFLGLLAFSKQGLLTPFYCWALPVCALRFRLSLLQVITCLLGMFFVFQYLVPYSQFGRRYLIDNPGNAERIAIALPLLEHPEKTRERYEKVQEQGPGGGRYYNTAQGFWDRLTFIAVDDSLIDVTNQGRVFGYTPIAEEFINAVPHFILPNKPSLNFGNVYAHEIGGLPDDDTTTGISFSPTAEAYHMGTWFGVLVVAPLIWLLLFVVLDALLGELPATPWGLLALALISHSAPEAALTGAIYLVTFGTAIFTFCAFFAVWIAPTFAIAVLGRDRRRSERRSLLRPTLTQPS